MSAEKQQLQVAVKLYVLCRFCMENMALKRLFFHLDLFQKFKILSQTVHSSMQSVLFY